MPSSPVSYSQYYMTPNQHQHQSSYSSQPITLHHPHEHAMAHHQQQQQHQQHMQAPPSPSIPIDPALALYTPTYYYQQQQPVPQHMSHQHLALPTSLSSPSSQGSESIGTPPIEPMSFPGGSNSNGKRPSSSMANGQPSDSRKKHKRDEGTDDASPAAEKQDEVKTKPTRGSR